MAKKFDIKNMAFAFGAGAAGGAAIIFIEDKLKEKAAKDGKEWKDGDEKKAPLIVAAAAVGLHYLGKGKMDSAAWGLLGAAGGDIGGQVYVNSQKDKVTEGATNGTPSQVSPNLNGLRERVIEMSERMKGRAGHAHHKVGRAGRSADSDFYVHPYAESLRSA